MFANLIPLVALLLGIILGMGMCLFIVKWAFEYERKLIIEFMDRDGAKDAIQNILVPKEKKEVINTQDVIALYANKGVAE